MEFDRVRTAEQRKIRVEQIKEAAIKLFDSKQFHEITLADIANETSFTRGNLYKYIATKEEIYLLVILDEITYWTEDLYQQVSVAYTEDIEGFARLWADVLWRHQRLLKLIALLVSIIEKNVSLEKLVAFKNSLNAQLKKGHLALETAFPHWTCATINRFFELQKNYAVGLYPSAAPTAIQVEAIALSDFDYVFPDFVEDFAEFISYTIVYLNRKESMK